MAEGLTTYKGADKPVSQVPEDLCPTGTKGAGPVESFKGAEKTSGASVPTDPVLNKGNVTVGKGSPIKSPIDK